MKRSSGVPGVLCLQSAWLASIRFPQRIACQSTNPQLVWRSFAQNNIRAILSLKSLVDIRALGRILLTLLGLLPVAASAGPLIIGGFDAARGGYESLAAGENTALAGDITAAFPGAAFQFTGTLDTSFLSGVNTVMLGVASSNTTAISPLSVAEQTALLSFVKGGGTALLFADNSTVTPVANASILSPFGVTSAGTLGSGATAQLLNSTGPLTGPFTPVTDFTTAYAGYFTDLGGGTLLADFNHNPSEGAIDYFAPGLLGAGSGAVVLFSDSNAIVGKGIAVSTTDLDLMLNALALTSTGSPAPTAPEPGAYALMLTGLGLIAVYKARWKTARSTR